MEKTKVMLLVVMVLLGLQMIPQVKAWGPNTHVDITKNALERSKSRMAQTIKNHPDAFYCGLLFPDITVLYYYTKFEAYRATHSWLFYRRLLEEAHTEEERAFAYGVAVHLIQDSVSHNQYIPKKIRGTLGSNFYTHPLVEAAVEEKHFDVSTSGALDPVDNFLPLATRVLQRDVTGVTHTFRDIVRAGSFYEDAYAAPEVPFWDFYRWLAGWFEKVYTVGDSDLYLDKATDLTVHFLETGETPAKDPSGINRLASASSYSNQIRFLLTFITAMAAGVIYLQWKRRRP